MNARLCLLVLALGCGGGGASTSTTPVGAETGGDTSARSSEPQGPVATVGAALSVTPANATVTIDDASIGVASELAPVIGLAPGLHTLVVSAPGYKAYRAEFSVTDKVERFTVRLEPN